MKVLTSLFAVCLAASLSDMTKSEVRAATAPSAPETASSSAPAAAPTPHPKGDATYYFGTNPARTQITFESKTNVTNILGQTNNCSGSATIDFDAKKGQCHLIVQAGTLNSGMDDRDRAMHGKTWLDSKTNKTIEFKTTKATFVEGSTWKLEGDFLFRGVTKPIAIDVEVRPVPPSIGQKLGEGAWIRVRTAFKVDITEHGIKIDKSAQFTVEPVWNVAIELFGTTAKPAGAPAATPVVDEGEENITIVRVPKLAPEGLPGMLYEFGKKPQLTTLRATSSTNLGTITASVNATHGWVGVDKAKGVAGMRLHVPVGQLKTGLKERDAELRSEGWLDEKNHKYIFFESLKGSKKDDKTWNFDGILKLRGVEKPLSLTLVLEDVTSDEVKKANWGERPGVRLTGGFNLKLSDFGVKIPEAKIVEVSDTLAVTVYIIGLLQEEK